MFTSFSIGGHLSTCQIDIGEGSQRRTPCPCDSGVNLSRMSDGDSREVLCVKRTLEEIHRLVLLLVAKRKHHPHHHKTALGRDRHPALRFSLLTRPRALCPDLPLRLAGGGSDPAHLGKCRPEKFAHPAPAAQNRRKQPETALAPQCQAIALLPACTPRCGPLALHWQAGTLKETPDPDSFHQLHQEGGH